MSVIEGVPGASCAKSGAAMVQSHGLLRAEVREQVGWEYVDEFDRLFPEWDDLGHQGPRKPRRVRHTTITVHAPCSSSS